jgi:hypothetical protein
VKRFLCIKKMSSDAATKASLGSMVTQPSATVVMLSSNYCSQGSLSDPLGVLTATEYVDVSAIISNRLRNHLKFSSTVPFSKTDWLSVSGLAIAMQCSVNLLIRGQLILSRQGMHQFSGNEEGKCEYSLVSQRNNQKPCIDTNNRGLISS